MRKTWNSRDSKGVTRETRVKGKKSRAQKRSRSNVRTDPGKRGTGGRRQGRVERWLCAISNQRAKKRERDINGKGGEGKKEMHQGVHQTERSGKRWGERPGHKKKKSQQKVNGLKRRGGQSRVVGWCNG